jgi:phage regulator Rha-like protein
MQNLITQNKDGSLTVSSLVIAELFGRTHGNVLKSIDIVNEKLLENRQVAINSGYYADSNGDKQERFYQRLCNWQFLNNHNERQSKKTCFGYFAKIK